MVSSKPLKVIELLAFYWLLAVPIDAQFARWPFYSRNQDIFRESEINTPLDDSVERWRLSSSVDRAISRRPHQVPFCGQNGHIYDTTGKVCGEARTKAHCGDNMVFLPVPNILGLGACACTNTNSLQPWGRPQVIAGNFRCYGIATRGPCGLGETLVPISKSDAQCSPYACLYSTPENAHNLPDESIRNPSDPPIFNFTYRGKCYLTETQAFCPRGQVARFIMPDKIPVCTNRNDGNGRNFPMVWPIPLNFPETISPTTGASLQNGGIQGCEPGSVAHHITRSCQQQSSFNLR